MISPLCQSSISCVTKASKSNIISNFVVFVKRKCSSSMKAVLIHEYGCPKVMKVEEVPVPKPTKREVLVEVHAAGVNPVDCLLREGAFMKLPKLPIILGKEASGIVKEIGPLVEHCKVGDRVTCCLPFDGGYAQYVTCDERKTIPLSDKLSFPQGAALYVTYFIAYRALVTKCKIKPGEKILVHGGSGGVGIASIQLAKAKGLSVYATASTEEGLETMKAAGADQVFNHKTKEYILNLAASVSIKGFDVILENCAEENLGKDFTILSRNGRIAVVGAGTSLRHIPGKKPTKLVQINPRFLVYTEGRVFGINLSSMTEAEFEETKSELVKGIESGWLRPVINKEFPLSQASLAHSLLFSDSGAQGKIVLKVSS